MQYQFATNQLLANYFIAFPYYYVCVNKLTYHGSAYVRLDAYFSFPAPMVKLSTTHTSITCVAVPMNQTAPPTETTTTAQVTVGDSSAMEQHVAAAERALKKPRKAQLLKLPI